MTKPIDLLALSLHMNNYTVCRSAKQTSSVQEARSEDIGSNMLRASLIVLALVACVFLAELTEVCMYKLLPAVCLLKGLPVYIYIAIGQTDCE